MDDPEKILDQPPAEKDAFGESPLATLQRRLQKQGVNMRVSYYLDLAHGRLASALD